MRSEERFWSDPSFVAEPQSRYADEPRKHHRLVVWQNAIEVAVDVYGLSEQLPDSERFGLTAQIRRSAISVGSNIAEGAGRGSEREFARFLRIARGSLSELETQLILCDRLFGLRPERALLEKISTTFAKLSALINRIEGDRK